MAEPVYFPSLSETGWVTASEQLADLLFAQFFESDYSQTQLYVGNVSSMAWVIAQEQDNPTQMVLLMRRTLQTYFSRYFSNVTVEVRDVPDKQDGSATALTIYLDFTDYEGKQYTLARIIQDAGSKSARVISINNTGA